MKLYIEDDESNPAIQYLPDADPNPSNYTITVDPEDWNKYIKVIVDYNDAVYSDVRNEMIVQFEPEWDTYTDGQQKALIENYIWPAATPTTELDNLYDQDERDVYQDAVIIMLNVGVIHIIKSPTSTKHFIVSVNDSGQLVDPLPQITTDTTI